MKKIKSNSNIKNIIMTYVKNNSKEYILVSLIFIIGLFLGVMFINNISEAKEQVISNYIFDFLEKFQNLKQIDKTSMFLKSLKNNLILAIILWFAGTTIVAIPAVIIMLLFRGFCLGYTISAFTLTLGVKKALIFCFLTLFLHNIFFIPSIITLVVSSIKLYKSIIKDRRKENIKIEIIRHTLILFIILIILFICSFIENNITVILLKWGINYIMWKNVTVHFTEL